MRQQFIDGLAYPSFVCEHCGGQIEKACDGLLVHQEWDNNEEHMKVFHRTCIQSMEQQRAYNAVFTQELDTWLMQMMIRFMGAKQLEKGDINVYEALDREKPYHMKVEIPRNFWFSMAIR